MNEIKEELEKEIFENYFELNIIPEIEIEENKIIEIKKDIFKKENHMIYKMIEEYENLELFLEIDKIYSILIENEYYNIIIDLNEYLKEYKKSLNMNLLLKRIQEKLKQEIDLNEYLLLISLLKRLNILDEYELMILFLQSRFEYFHSIEINSNNSFLFLNQYISKMKINLLNIIIQFQTCFNNDSILSLFIHPILRDFIKLFQFHLFQIRDSDELFRLYENLKLCSESFSKISIDLKGLVNHFFLKRIQDLFILNISSFKLNIWKQFIGNQFLILSQLQNDLIISLNQLRKFPPLELKYYFKNQFQNLLNHLIHSVNEFHFNDKLLQLQFLKEFKKMIEILSDHFQSIYPIQLHLINYLF